ncbi:BatA domain-containing protein [Pseudoxanthomonas dokdonensis]|uniref:Aerotolerance regulator N-terminal domain-containing protein n=1 Tax=Pseudoxanthomonas dokdonensis TaxID=344882 RepID=A0A0R0CR79_9GAMM|nr:BatA domain-containing protein [Pseudoxanthomonas dokdonensis]KRG72021.1 hypothetical protein ABB29_00730 [Pseudoxanthomonas dokdonensis]
MSLALLLPAGLAALAALLLPLLLHLARRSQQTPLPFAALRWLRRKPRPRRQIRFDEWLLLVLRLLLLALLALWLARPVLSGAPDRRPWVAVAPGVDAGQLSALPLPLDARLHWLAPQWPALADVPTLPAPADAASISSLLRQLDQELPAATPLTVIVPSVLQGVDAQRPRLSRGIDWRVLPGQMPAPAAARTRTLAVDLRVAQDCGDNCVPGGRYLRAALNAWQTPATRQSGYAAGHRDEHAAIATSAGKEVPADGKMVLFWWLPDPVPAAVWRWVSDGGSLVLPSTVQLPVAAAKGKQPVLAPAASNAGDGQPLLQATRWQRGRVLRFSQPLRPSSMPQLLQAEFPATLRQALQPETTAPSRVAADTFRPLTGAEPGRAVPRDLRDWLLPIILLLFAAERWLATRRSRGAAP